MVDSPPVGASSEKEIDFNFFPITALNITSRMILSKFLNPEMDLPSSQNIARDFRGLAQQMGFDYDEIKNFQLKPDRTTAVLDAWKSNPRATIGSLLSILRMMDRQDVIEEVLPHFKNDAISYCERKRSLHENLRSLSAGTTCCLSESYNMNSSREITIDDLENGGMTDYDAYVCYSEAEEDKHFIHELTEYLESPDIGLKLCLKERDVLLGNFDCDSYVRLIDKRCRVLILVLTPEFLCSKECEFQMNYAAGLAADQRQRKLIPIVLKTCEIPPVLKFLTRVDFTKKTKHHWMWKRLLASIRGLRVSFGHTASSTTGPSSFPSTLSESDSSSSPLSPPKAAGFSLSSSYYSGLSKSLPSLAVASPPSDVKRKMSAPQVRKRIISLRKPMFIFPPSYRHHTDAPDVTQSSLEASSTYASAAHTLSEGFTVSPATLTPTNTPPVRRKELENLNEELLSSSSSTYPSFSSSMTIKFHSETETLSTSSEITDSVVNAPLKQSYKSISSETTQSSSVSDNYDSNNESV